MTFSIRVKKMIRFFKVKNDKKERPKSSKIWSNFILNISLVIIIFVVGIFIGFIVRNSRLINNEVLSRARSYFVDIVLTRRWNANYGGVYVEKKEEVLSNPYLENPDIEAVDGKIYTKKNPALMTREISTYAEKEGLFKFHITSLRPLNPNNRADEFEQPALQRFEEGEKEYFKTIKEKGKFFFRYMAPLYVEESCLSCHAKQGYKAGDIRGGISVTFDVSRIKNTIKWQNNTLIVLSILSAAVLLGIIYFFIMRLSNRLSDAYSKIEEMAMVDDLMQILNRRFFFNRLQEELQRARRYNLHLGCILIDIDHFKKVNDRYGHQTGDMVLKHIASKIKEKIRKTDIIARYGGEEIGIILPNADEQEACGVAEKIRNFFENETFIVDDIIKIRVTVSLGVVAATPEELKGIEDYNLIIRLADNALYEAKKNGRNRTEVARLIEL